MMRSLSRLGAPVLTLAFLAAAGAVQTEPTKTFDPISLRAPGGFSSPIPDKVQPIAPALAAYAQLLKQRMNGVAQTSVASRFDKDTVGEAGFLCGLQPHPDTSGAAAAFGHDPDGRFVGAKLRLAF